jgi:ribosomal protein S18 acetylase RimI-like enzyme
MSDFSIRPAKKEDVPAIARVHVATWQTTYRGVMPDTLLDNLSIKDREDQWMTAVTHPRLPNFVYVAQTANNEVVGLASGGPPQTRMIGYAGELYALYVLEAHQRKGIGRALFHATVAHLLGDEINTMVLWVLQDNKGSRAFYKALGGKKVGTKPYQVGEEILNAVAYGYDNLRVLQKGF